MDAIKGANLALRLLLEPGAVVAFRYWDFKAGDGRGMKVLLGILAATFPSATPMRHTRQDRAAQVQGS